MTMREIGGYIELDTYHGLMLHKGAIALNCGRNALAYLCEAKAITNIYIPDFLCDSVSKLLDRIGVQHHRYSIEDNFLPVEFDLPEGAWLYVVNYYGQLSNEILVQLHQSYPNMIVDNAQSYYQMPVPGVDTLYTCRKYFGVADGAFLYTDVKITGEVERDESYDRMRFLLGRYERSASEFYAEYSANNKLFAEEPIKRMSQLTENLLHGIDYERVADQRQENFAYLHHELKAINGLQLSVPHGAFMYPLLLDQGTAIRKVMQQRKIYIPTLWPNVLQECPEDSIAYRYAANILPLPVDQRYNLEDMKYIVEELMDILVAMK